MKTKATIMVKVIKVTDGDTYKAKLPTGKKITVRMEGIDAPELKQEFGKQSKQFLQEIIEGKYVNLQITGIDKYNRILAYTNLTEHQEASWEMVVMGFAWHFKKYNSDELLRVAENVARIEQRGLWSDPNPVPPWDFRKQKKQNPIKKVFHI